MEKLFSMLEKLQTPAIILAGIVILLLFKLIFDILKSKNEFAVSVTVELTELNKVQASMAKLLDLLCNNILTNKRD
jgi:Na+/glutamate symporter